MKGIEFLPGFITGLLITGLALPAASQVTSDNTTNTTVNQNGNKFDILNGIQKGNNLFHSFKEFSIPTGGEAVFQNSSAIKNIINRITGGNISNIDGLIKSQGNANLFLINPAGIVFGENAKLDIGGSFFATTAESVLFEDGFEFSAVNPQSEPLLTVSVPLGLQMGTNPGAIEVNGSGHNLTLEDPALATLPIEWNNTSVGLEVDSGKTLALVGSNVNLVGGILTTPGGRIEIAAVSNNGTSQVVSLNSINSQWNLDLSNIEQLGNVNLSQQALLNSSGSGSSSIQVQGSRIRLQDGSVMVQENRGSQDFGDIFLRGTEAIELIGTVSNDDFRSGLIGDTLKTGKSGDIRLITPNLELNDGGMVISRNFSTGNGGNIFVDTDNFNIIAGGREDGFLITKTGGSGRGGNININTSTLNLQKGGSLVSSVSQSSGSGGDIILNATEAVNLIGLEDNVPYTVLIGASVIGGTGDAGNVRITTPKLKLSNGALISSSTFDAGNAGGIFINASELIEIAGSRLNPITGQEFSTIRSSALLLTPIVQQLLGLPDFVTGDAGNIEINTPSLQLSDGGTIKVNHESIGNAGKLEVNADRINLKGGGHFTATTQSGDGGNITLQVQDSLQIINNSFINTEALGNGNGGTISIASNNLILEDNSIINASAVSGVGGNIDLQIRNKLQLSKQSEIVADIKQAGRSGKITITAPETTLTQASIISNSAFGTATGSELRLTGDRLSILDGSRLSTLTYGSGQSGNLFIQAGDIEVSSMGNTPISGLGLVPNPSTVAAGTFPGSSGEGGNLIIESNRIRITDGGLIASGTLGGGASGNLEIYARESLEVNGTGNLPAPLFGYFTNHPSHISASSFSDAPAGYVKIVTPLFSVSDGGLVEVNGAGVGGAGNLEVVSDKISLNNGASLQAQVAGGNQGNISLGSNLLLLRQGSTISTNATNNANGGNITINSSVVAGFENSDIVANAVEGNGGNIQINTQGIFGLEFRNSLTSESDITASSQLGVNGTVEINNFGIDPSSGLVELSVELSDSSQQVSVGCSNNSESNFIVTGRGGIPQNPNQSLSFNSIWSDIRNLSVSPNQSNPSKEITRIPNQLAIVEATGFIRNHQGEVELVALENQSWTTKTLPTCSGKHT